MLIISKMSQRRENSIFFNNKLIALFHHSFPLQNLNPLYWKTERN